MQLAQTQDRAALPTDPSFDDVSAGTDPPGESAGEFVPRQRIGRYELLQQIGVGGMGVVFAAYDGVLDRQVAIKLVRSDRTDHASQARILREGRALARLSHPNVVAVHEVSSSAGQIFLVMEYVKGTTLRRWNESTRAVGEIVDMFVQAGRGLAAAHAQGLVHRDFKPDNVLIGADGRARVVDFGLVADPSRRRGEGGALDGAGEDGDQSLTRTGRSPGTPAYMAPEQFFGRGADARSDQFSFCVALHEALCGERPFAGATPLEIQLAVGAGAIRPPRRSVPERLLAAIRRGLSPEPGDRWPTMEALLEVLARDPAERRRRGARLAGLLLLVAVVVAAVVLVAGELRRRDELERREQEAAGQLAEVSSRIDAARAQGDLAAAARTFDDFTTDPRFRETAALPRAWLEEAERRRQDDALDAASLAYARAFVHARTPEQGLAALDGLAAGFRVRHRWDALAEVLEAAGRVDPRALGAPARRALAVEAALGRRDVAGARGLLLSEGTSSTRVLLERLSAGARETEFDDVQAIYGLDGRHDLEGDGTPELVLRRHDPGGTRLDVVRLDPALTRVATYNTADLPAPRIDLLIPLVPDRDGRLLLLGSGRSEDAPFSAFVRAGSGDRLEVTRTWTESLALAVTSGDLDGDGVPETYFGTQLETRRLVELVRGPDGDLRTRLPIAAGDEPESDIMDLLVADLDADGRRELVMATGPWQSYDVRVYRRGGDGLLRLVDRDMLGTVFSLRTVRRGDELLIAASHVENFPSRLMFPAERPFGEPPGVYLLRLRDDRLARTDFIPLPPAAGTQTFNAELRGPADLDGDGREDLAVSFTRDKARNTMFLPQQADGRFTPVLLGQASFLGAVELDGDPEPESLLVLGADRHFGRLWIVGAGDDRLPVAPRPEPPARLPAPTDMWREPWERAGDLRAMGLHASAAETFEEIARGADEPGLRGRALLAAAHEREQDGDFVRAAEGFDRAGERPELAVEAARGAHRSYLRLGEYAAARDALGRLLARPDDLPDRPALADAHARLQAVAEGQARVELTFERPLSPMWTIADPLALRRDSAGGTLDIDTTSGGLLASLPLEVDSEAVELAADLTLEQMEWSAALRLELVPEGGTESSVGLSISASGGGRQTRRIFFCHFGRQIVCPHSSPPIPSDTAAPVSLRATSVRALAEQSCVLGQREANARDVARGDGASLAVSPGRYRLVVRSTGQDGPARLRVKIRRISIVGAELPADPGCADEGDPQARLGRALVEGSFAAAHDLVRAPLALTPQERVWAIDLALRSGDLAEATGELAALLRADAGDPGLAGALHTLLRRDPDLYAPVLRSASPRDFLVRFAEAWAVPVRQHIDEPRVPEAVLDVLGRVDPAGLAGPGAAAADVELAITLLTWRALAHNYMRRPEEARRDLERALELTRRTPAEPVTGKRRDLLIEMAALEAARGDVSAARRLADEALAESVNKIAAHDMLRARRELAPVLGP